MPQFPHWRLSGPLTEVAGLLASNLAIEAHHGGDPVVDRVIARIAFSHRQLADLGNLSGACLCAALELARCRNAFDDLHQAANSPRGFYDSVLIGFAHQDQGIEKSQDRQDRRLPRQDH